MTAAIVDLTDDRRALAVPVVIDCFTGIYRWHAKRTLREVPRVRAIFDGPEVAGAALLDELTPEVGYVYYLLVRSRNRGQGLGGRLLDDALAQFHAAGRVVVYVATSTDNEPMVRMLARRGFRPVDRKETSWRDGGLGPWGLLSRMRVGYGETLYGRRADGPGPRPTGP